MDISQVVDRLELVEVWGSLWTKGFYICQVKDMPDLLPVFQ